MQRSVLSLTTKTRNSKCVGVVRGVSRPAVLRIKSWPSCKLTWLSETTTIFTWELTSTTVDASEIRSSPVEVISLSHYSRGFYTSQVFFQISDPSKVQHQSSLVGNPSSIPTTGPCFHPSLLLDPRPPDPFPSAVEATTKPTIRP